MSELKPWDLVDPAACLRAISRLERFTSPRAVLGLVTPGRQHVLAATTLWHEPPADDLARTDITEEALRRLGLKEYDAAAFRDRPLVVPVIIVDGPCWWSIDVDEVRLGLRYANNWFQVPTSNPYVVNRHGWYDVFDERCGTTPAATFDRRSGRLALARSDRKP